MKQKILATLLVLTAIVGCKKTPTTINTPIDPALKAAFNYQVGTYWIYKDSISGGLDSFYVVDNSLSNNLTSSTDLYIYTDDYMTVDIYEYNIAASKLEEQTMKLDFLGNEICLTTYAKNVTEGGLDIQPLIKYPFPKIILSGLSGNNTGAGDTFNAYLFDTYNLNGNTYNNVEEIYHWCHMSAQKNYPLNTPYSYDNWFYLSSDVGFLKICLNQPYDSLNRVWILQRYKIVKA